MIYRYLVIGDIHWGAMDSKLMYQHLELFLETIRQLKNRLDFIVICGDYFHYRLQLNSKTALRAVQWFDELVTTCKESGVKYIRVIKGTLDHDNDQLEIFRPAYEGDDYIKIYNHTTVEEIFDGFRCIFCPDEPITIEEFHKKYYIEFSEEIHIGFFHGNFDIRLPSIEYDRIRKNNLKVIVYPYYELSRLIKGPMIAGHWHQRYENDNFYYVGSFDRWKYGEEEPKGFIYGEYNTETDKYYIKYFDNIYAHLYKSLYISSTDVKSPSDFGESYEIIHNLLQHPNCNIRVVYVYGEENDEALQAWNNFQKSFHTIKRVKFLLQDIIKKKSKKEKKEMTRIGLEKYSYIFDKGISIIDKVYQYIDEDQNNDITKDEITKYLSKYLE